MMRRALVDAARVRRAIKRGGGAESVPLDEADEPPADAHVELLEIEEALQALAAVNERASQVAELRFVDGFTVEETAEALGVSVRTVINDWNIARAWLYRALSNRTPGRRRS